MYYYHYTASKHACKRYLYCTVCVINRVLGQPSQRQAVLYNNLSRRVRHPMQCPLKSIRPSVYLYARNNLRTAKQILMAIDFGGIYEKLYNHFIRTLKEFSRDVWAQSSLSTFICKSAVFTTYSASYLTSSVGTRTVVTVIIIIIIIITVLGSNCRLWLLSSSSLSTVFGNTVRHFIQTKSLETQCLVCICQNKQAVSSPVNMALQFCTEVNRLTWFLLTNSFRFW
jgi:hypothetical protein